MLASTSLLVLMIREAPKFCVFLQCCLRRTHGLLHHLALSSRSIKTCLNTRIAALGSSLSWLLFASALILKCRVNTRLQGERNKHPKRYLVCGLFVVKEHQKAWSKAQRKLPSALWSWSSFADIHFSSWCMSTANLSIQTVRTAYSSLSLCYYFCRRFLASIESVFAGNLLNHART